MVLLDINVIRQDIYSKRDGFQMSTYALPLRHLASEIKRDGFQMSTHALPLRQLASEIKKGRLSNEHTFKREGECARLKVISFYFTR